MSHNLSTKASSESQPLDKGYSVEARWRQNPLRGWYTVDKIVVHSLPPRSSTGPRQHRTLPSSTSKRRHAWGVDIAWCSHKQVTTSHGVPTSKSNTTSPIRAVLTQVALVSFPVTSTTCRNPMFLVTEGDDVAVPAGVKTAVMLYLS
jgi:hypothetical protein